MSSFFGDAFRAFLKYMGRYCSSCGIKIAMGEGWQSYGSWNWLCDSCFYDSRSVSR